MKSYVDQNGIMWVPIGDVARDFQKARWTLIRWARDGFLLRLGYNVKRDLSGYWYVGRPSQPSQSSLP